MMKKHRFSLIPQHFHRFQVMKNDKKRCKKPWIPLYAEVVKSIKNVVGESKKSLILCGF